MSMIGEQFSPTSSRLLTGLSSVDAISILREDHRRVDDMFRQFDKVRGNDQKAALAVRICAELLIHAQVEEEIFYPAMRETIGDDDLLDAADIEHGVAAGLIVDILKLRLGEDHYIARVKVLGEYVRHHVQEEQNQMFSKARQARLDMRALGQQILDRKVELKRTTFYGHWPAAVADAVSAQARLASMQGA